MPPAVATIADEARKLSKTSVDPEVGSSGTENYSGWLYREPVSALQTYAGHGYSGTAIGEYETLARTDPAVAVMMSSVTKPIIDATWRVDGPDKEICEFVEDALFEWLEPTFTEVLRQQIRGRQVHGFELFEVVPGRRPDKRVPGGVAFTIGRMPERLQRTIIGGWIREDGQLKAIKQRPYGPVAVWVEIPAEQVMLSTREREGDNYEGTSALRPCWYAGKMRAHILKTLGIAIDREVLGIPVLKSTQIAADKDKMDTALADLEKLRVHEMNAYVIGGEDELSWWHSDVSNRTNLLEMYERLGNAMMLAWSLQFLGLGSTETGARSVGEVHNDLFFASLRGEALSIASDWNGVANRAYTGPIKRLVDWNFGPQDEYPYLTVTLKKPEQLAAVASIASHMRVDDADAQNAMRDMAGLPPLPKDADGNTILPPAPTREPTGDGGPPEPPKRKGGPNPREVGPSGPSGDPADTTLAERGGRRVKLVGEFTPTRALRPEEQHLALTEMAGMLEDAPRRFANQVGRAVERIVRASRNRYRRLVETRDAEGLRKLPVLKGPEIEAAIRRYVDELREAGARHVRMEHDSQRVDPREIVRERKVGETGLAEWTVERLEAGWRPPLGLAHRLARWCGRINSKAVALAAGGGGRFDDLDADELAEALAHDLAEDVLSRVQRSATTTAAQQMTRGAWDEGAFTSAVEAVAGPQALARDAAAVTVQAFNLGREEAAEQFGDEVEAVQRSEILDANTCGVCSAADGRTFEFGSDAHDENLPPDPECESVQSGTNRCRGLLVYLFAK